MTEDLKENLINKDTGLPDMGEDEKNEGQSKGIKVLFLMPTIF